MDKDEEIKKRILEIVEDRGGNQSRFSRDLGLAPSLLATVVGNKDKGVSATILKSIAEESNVNMNWLFNGKGGMYVDDEKKLEERLENSEAELTTFQETVSNLEYYIKQLERLIKAAK